jgi:hypothetical protein
MQSWKRALVRDFLVVCIATISFPAAFYCSQWLGGQCFSSKKSVLLLPALLAPCWMQRAHVRDCARQAVDLGKMRSLGVRLFQVHVAGALLVPHVRPRAQEHARTLTSTCTYACTRTYENKHTQRRLRLRMMMMSCWRSLERCCAMTCVARCVCVLTCQVLAALRIP